MGGFPDEKAPFDPSMNQAGSSFAPFHSHFASLSFDSNDHIRLLNFPESDVQAFHSVVSQSWPKGVKSIGSYGPSVDLKLHGYPFAQVGSTSEMNSCILVRSILSHLFNSGWILHQSVNVLRSSALTDSLIFRNQTPPPPPASWFTLSFYLSDRLRLSGADQEVIGDFGTLLKSLGMWQNEEWKDEQLGVYEFKLCSIPWSNSGEDSMKTRGLLLKILQLLEGHGWSLYASVDQQTSASDFWYLIKMADWVPGKPIFHK